MLARCCGKANGVVAVPQFLSASIGRCNLFKYLCGALPLDLKIRKSIGQEMPHVFLIRNYQHMTLGPMGPLLLGSNYPIPKPGTHRFKHGAITVRKGNANSLYGWFSNMTLAIRKGSEVRKKYIVSPFVHIAIITNSSVAVPVAEWLAWRMRYALEANP